MRPAGKTRRRSRISGIRRGGAPRPVGMQRLPTGKRFPGRDTSLALPAPDERILSVAEITRAIKDLLGGTFPGVWVKGEISGFKGPHTNGHLYFTLKDAKACLSCVMFRTEALRLAFPLRDGAEVEAFGEISVFEQRGRYELVVRQMRLAGIGLLLVRLEELKRRLAAEGLFDAARKQPLP